MPVWLVDADDVFLAQGKGSMSMEGVHSQLAKRQ